MKPTLRFTFLVAALVLLLVPQLAAAAGGPDKAADRSDGQAECKPLPEGVGLLADPVDGLAEHKGGITPKIIGGPCSWCTSNSNCSQECDDNGTPSTCGDYGLCDPCREAIVEIGRQIVGISTRHYILPYAVDYCEEVTHYWVTWKSQNAGCSSFTTCEKDTTGYAVIIFGTCCEAFGCFGLNC